MRKFLRPACLGLLVLAVGVAGAWWLAKVGSSASGPGASSSVAPAPAQASVESPASGAGATSVPTRSAAPAKPVPRALDLRPESVERRLRESVEYLASDELGGRGLGSRGIDLAAEYIGRELGAAGMRTDLFSQKPFQEFAITERLALGSANRAELSGPAGRRIALSLNKDYRPLSWSRTGAFDFPLVFAGYGITASNLGYDDYAGLDVAGKAVIVLRHEPQQDDPSSVFEGVRQTEHAYVMRKIVNAAEHGAAGILLCTEQRSVAKRPTETPRNRQTPFEADPLLNFAVRGRPPAQPILVLHCRRARVEELVQSARGMSLADLEQRIDQGLKPQSFEMPGWRIAGEVSTTRQRRSLKNVVAVLDARGDRAEEAIVLGAHYDHLGTGGITSLAPGTAKVHHGADDNASGTAVLIEVARQLAARKAPLGRRVVCVAFTAEEAGLVGSEEYCNHPWVRLKKTCAMINLDMVGRLRQQRLMVFGAETAAPLRPLVQRLASPYGLLPRFAPAEFGPSDHLSFYERGVPVLHFFTGLHADYHRPSDTADRLNYEGMRKIAGLVADVAAELANADRLEPNRRAFEYLGLEPTPAAARMPYLGAARDTAHGGPGYAVASVPRGSPAERAGLRAGDLIVRAAGEEIRDPADLVQRVGRSKPGDRLVLVIRRGGALLELGVVLGGR